MRACGSFVLSCRSRVRLPKNWPRVFWQVRGAKGGFSLMIFGRRAGRGDRQPSPQIGRKAGREGLGATATGVNDVPCATGEKDSQPCEG